MNINDLTDDQIAALQSVAEAQLRGETFEHAAAAASAGYQNALHCNDGGADHDCDSNLTEWQSI